MTVRVHLPRMLTEHAGGAQAIEVDCAGGAALSEVIALVSAAYPALGRRLVDETGALRRHVNIYVDGEECRRLRGLETPVPDGARIDVIGSIAGGCLGRSG